MIRLEPIPPNCPAHDCKFCGGKAVAHITIGNGKRLRMVWRICELCVESWRLTLERRKQVA